MSDSTASNNYSMHACTQKLKALSKNNRTSYIKCTDGTKIKKQTETRDGQRTNKAEIEIAEDVASVGCGAV